MGQAARAFLDSGARAVLVKGGHDQAELLVDRLYTDSEIHEFVSPRLPGEYHGTGCCLSTAIACNLACGKPLVDAVRDAHDFIARAQCSHSRSDMERRCSTRSAHRASEAHDSLAIVSNDKANPEERP